jgi:hypothetical protein
MPLRLAALDRSLVLGARANAAQAVQQNARSAELRRQAATAQATAQALALGEVRAPVSR